MPAAREDGAKRKRMEKTGQRIEVTYLLMMWAGEVEVKLINPFIQILTGREGVGSRLQ